ncbi:MAG: VCBS repeat-containing protein [Myxococcales bacterium]|nr:VCBS repeat-containing protein [Myxococcales bacterium]
MTRLALALALTLAGCTLSYPDVDDAPAATGGQVTGRVVLPDGFLDTTLEAGHVDLTDGASAPRQAALGEGGRFTFEGVPAGTYTLTVRLFGFAGGASGVAVTEGGTTDLGAVRLRVDTLGRVTGRATRAGAASHAGILVQAEGTRYATRTTANGDFDLELTPGPQVLRFSAAGYAAATASVDVPADDAIALEPIVLAGLPGRVTGVVALPPGLDDVALLRETVVALARPSDDAPRTLSPDDAGRFAFDGVPADTWLLSLDHPVLGAPPAVEVAVAVGATAPVGVLRLRAGAPATLRGVARLEGAGDAGHADIAVDVAGLAGGTTTATDGAWSLEVPPLDAYTVRFARAGYAPVEVEVPGVAAGATHSVDDVVLRARPGRVHGVVVVRGADGAVRPFEEALRARTVISLIDLDDAEAAPRLAAPAPDGRFAFEDVPPGHHGLQLELTGYDPPRVPPVDLAPGATVNVGLLDLTPRVDAAVRGRVLRACAGVCEHGGTRVEAAGTPYVTFTGGDGAFRLPVAEGTYDLAFSHPGFRPARVEGVAVQGVVILPAQPPLELLPTDLTGHVERALPGGGAVDAADAQVILADAAGAPVDTTATDGAGRFRLTPRVPTGAYTVELRQDRHAPRALPVQLAAGEPLDLGTTRLEPLRGALTGRVAGVTGRVATVQVRGRVDDAVTAGWATEHAAAPPDLRFVVADLPVGAYDVVARAAGARAATASADVVADAEASVELALAPVSASIELPADVGASATARVTADPDLDHLRWWADTPTPPDDLPFDPLPDAATLALAPLGEGPHTLYLQLANADHVADPGRLGAVTSDVVRVAVVVDLQPPVVRRVQVAGGQVLVNRLTVPVTVEGEGDLLAVWNDPGDACAAAPACPDAAAYVPFTRALTHTLEGPRGAKRVCWQVCDAACNCAGPGAVEVTLGDYVPRPTPTLSALRPLDVQIGDPSSLIAIPDALGGGVGLALEGRGVAPDTVAQVGEQVFPCQVPADASGCTADPDGACAEVEAPGPAPAPDAPACADRCARTCYVRVTDDDRLLRNAGTYPVRLRTPAPVSGAGASEALYLDVVSPIPRIQSTTPRGTLVVDLSRPELLSLFTEGPEDDVTRLPPVVPETIDVQVIACRVADNGQFRLGGSIGTPLAPFTDVEPPTDGPCAGLPTRHYRLRFDARGVVGLPREAHRLVAINPGPGGGEASAPFGLNTFESACMEAGRCAEALPSTRARLPGGAGHAVALQIDPTRRNTGLGWWGGDLFDLRRRYLAGDISTVSAGVEYLPRGAYQLRRESAGGVAPPAMTDPFAALVVDLDGPQSRVVVQSVTRRSDGNFGDGAEVARTGRQPVDLAVTDVDADGRLDLVTADCGDDAVSLLRGLPDGGLARGDGPAMGRCPTFLRVADLNGDGHADLLAGSGEAPARVSVRLNRGDGTFAPAVVWNVPAESDAAMTGMAVGDLDHDGHVDLVTAAPGDGVAWRHGLGDGNFAGFAVLETAEPLPALSALTLVDLDRDRRLDLVALEAGGGVRTWRGTGAHAADRPAFDTPYRLATAAVVTVDHGDLDMDTLPDLVVGGCAGVTVLRNRNDGTFAAAPPIAAPGCVTHLVLADVTGDGRADVVAAHDGPGVVVYAGDGAGGLGAPTPLTLAGLGAPGGLAVVDLDGDGALDVLVNDAANHQVLRAAGLGREAFGAPRRTYEAGGSPWNVVPADLDGDAWPDLVVLDEAPPTLRPFLNNGDGTLRAGPPVPTPGFVPISALAGDLDGDGAPELVVAPLDGGDLRVYPLAADGGLGPAQPIPLPATCNPVPAFCARTYDRARDRLRLIDLEGDGALSLVAHCGGDLAVLRAYDPATGFGDAEVLASNGCSAGFSALDVAGTWGLVTGAPDVSETLVHRAGQTYDLGGFRATITIGYLVEDADLDGRDDLYRAQVSGASYEYLSQRRWASLAALRPADLAGTADDYFPASRALPHGIWTRTADADGDGRADRIHFDRDLPDVLIDLAWRAPYGQQWGRKARVPHRAPAQGTAVAAVDLDRDGGLDLVATADPIGRLVHWPDAAEGAWTVYHRRLVDPVELPPPGAPARIDLPHAPYVVHAFAARLRVEGTEVAGVRARLLTPDGATIDLGAAPAGTLWQPVLTERTADLTAAHGHQVSDPWQVLVETGPDTDARVTDVELAAYVSFQQVRPGRRAARPAPVRWGPGAVAKALTDSTLGGVDTTTVGCADTDGAGRAPEAWFALDLPANNTLSLQLAASFDGALELRRGPCAAPAAAVACAAGRGARLDDVAVTAGAWCVVVDGQDAARSQAGAFDLFLRVATPVTPDCAPDCEPPPPPPPPDVDAPGVVDCRGDACDTRAGSVCCLGGGGSSGCERQCDGLTVTVECDGPEDCAAGWLCCASVAGGARCAATCGAEALPLCHTDADCAADTPCTTCPVPLIDELNVCAVDCAGLP